MALLLRCARPRREADAAFRRLEAYVPAPPMDTPEHTVMDSVRLAEIYAFRGHAGRAFATLMRELDPLAPAPGTPPRDVVSCATNRDVVAVPEAAARRSALGGIHEGAGLIQSETGVQRAARRALRSPVDSPS